MPSKILLFGGLYIADCLLDGVFFDADTMQIAGTCRAQKDGMKFQCWGN